MTRQVRVNPVRVRRVVGADNALERHASVLCALRQHAVELAACEGCDHFVRLRQDEDGRSVVVCRSDENAPAERRRRDVPSAADLTRVSEVMTTDVLCVAAGAPIVTVRELLAERGYHGVPVVDESGAPIGMLSVQDLARPRPAGEAEPPATVSGWMTPLAFTVAESASVAQAAALMAFEHIHRLPVVGPEGALVGLVSAHDVLRWLARHEGYVLP